MKKLLFFLIIISITNAFTVKAQEYKTALNFGVGVLYGIGGYIACDHSTIILNEHSAWTAGGYLGMQRGDGYGMDCGLMGGNDTYRYDYKWLLAPRLGYVYSFSKHFDLYATLMPGLLINDKYDNKHVKYSFYTGITGGGRVQLFKNLYFFTEFGYNLLSINAGISVKF